jgi:hypothetical protein
MTYAIFLDLIIMTKLGEFDRCTKLYLVENFAKPWNGKPGPWSAEVPNQFV